MDGAAMALENQAPRGSFTHRSTPNLLLQFSYVLLLMGLAVSMPANLALSHEFTVAGTISYKIFSPTGDIRVHQLDEFTLGVRDCNWYIKKVPVLFERAGKRVSLTGTTEVSSDTENFYQLTHLRFSKDRLLEDRLLGRIGPGPAPFDLSDPKLIVLWYSYASTCYLKAIGGCEGYVVPPTTLGTEDIYAKDFRVLAAWKSGDGKLGFPEQIHFDSRAKFEASAADIAVRRWHSTNCILTVNDYITTNGFAVPGDVLVQMFSEPKPSHPTRLTATIAVAARYLSQDCSITNFVPRLTKVADISDMRTISSNTPYGIVALATTNWPRIEASRALAAAILPALNSKGNKISGWKRPVIVACFALIFLSPAVILLKKVVQAKTMKPDSNPKL